MPVRVSPFLCRFSMAGRCGHRPLRNITMRGANFPGRRGNRRSAASGRRSEAISRKCPDWQARIVPVSRLARRWATAAPYGGCKGCGGAGDRKGRPYGGLQVVQGAGRCRHRPLHKITKKRPPTAGARFISREPQYDSCLSRRSRIRPRWSTRGQKYRRARS